MGHPAREPARRWTAEDRDVINTAVEAGDLPTEVALSDGRTVMVCLDEVSTLTTTGGSDALQRMLRDLARAGRTNDLPFGAAAAATDRP